MNGVYCNVTLTEHLTFAGICLVVISAPGCRPAAGSRCGQTAYNPIHLGQALIVYVLWAWCLCVCVLNHSPRRYSQPISRVKPVTLSSQAGFCNFNVSMWFYKSSDWGLTPLSVVECVFLCVHINSCEQNKLNTDRTQQPSSCLCPNPTRDWCFPRLQANSNCNTHTHTHKYSSRPLWCTCPCTHTRKQPNKSAEPHKHTPGFSCFF